MNKFSASGKPIRQKAAEIPIMKDKCATCPFREGSPYAYLVPDLTRSALSEASRVCHSTGSNNGINSRTGKPSALCRGARDIQLSFFAALGFIASATDEAWADKWRSMEERTR